MHVYMFAYNTAKHESSLHTPFELMFGRKAILPIDINIEKKSAEELLDNYQRSTADMVSSIYTQK